MPSGDADVQVLQPDWPAPPSVRAICSTRSGGVSAGPYAGCNLGDHVGDDAAAVAANRAQFAQALSGARPVFLQQVHGVDCVRVNARTPDATVADAAWTGDTLIACTIMVADCLPVLLTRRDGLLVAAAHAGWRGLAGQGGVGVLEQVLVPFRAPALANASLGAINSVAKMRTAEGAEDSAEVIAWLGPCIGPDVFEVGPEVKVAFEAGAPEAAECFRPAHSGKWLADLAGLARQRLARAGVTAVYGNDSSAAWCTVSNPSRFFSHRRDRVSGRFAASIWRT